MDTLKHLALSIMHHDFKKNPYPAQTIFTETGSDHRNWMTEDMKNL